MRSTRIEIRHIDPLTDPDWDRAVLKIDGHSVFHRTAWARVLSEAYGHISSYLIVSVDEIDVALIPLMVVNSRLTGSRAVSLPFADSAGILWIKKTNVHEIQQALLNCVAPRGWDHLEFRNEMTLPSEAKAFRTFEGHSLDLRHGIKPIEQGLKASVRRAINKAASNGVRVEVERTHEAMKVYQNLHARTRKRHGLPPQPSRFFKAISRNLIGKGLGDIVLARHQGEPVAGAVFLYSAGRAIYKFGASDSDRWPLRPNHALMWAAIRHLVESGCRELTFGRTAQGDSGLSDFKKSWGTTSAEIRYFRYSFEESRWLPPASARPERHPWIFGHLPNCLNHLAGHLIYPHLD